MPRLRSDARRQLVLLDSSVNLFGHAASWEKARQLSGHPEREWTFALFVERAWVLSERIPQFFYEPLSGWDSTTYALRLCHALEAQSSTPTLSLGFRYFDSGYRAKNGVLSLPAQDERARGRHQVDAVGMEDGSIVFRNSWGAKWGWNGYGLMSQEYFETFVDAVIIRWRADHGPSPEMFEAIQQRKGRRQHRTFEDVEACWGVPNSLESTDVRVGQSRCVIKQWTVVSYETWEPVIVLELANRYRVVGRAHLHLSLEDGGIVLKELFVDPSVRRRGFGSLLLSEVEDRARRLNFDSLLAWVDEADAQTPFVGETQSFFGNRGWAWDPVETMRPMTMATVWKEIVD